MNRTGKKYVRKDGRRSRYEKDTRKKESEG
jgi:hypothetical protein